MRVGPGISGLRRAEDSKAHYRQLGASVAETRREVLRQQVTSFKTALETFALRHRDAIRADPVFRSKFHDMCRAVGVDPLASNKGAFNRLLGFGDYYYALAVQVLEACRATRDADGGLTELGAVRRAVQRKRGGSVEAVGDEDVVRAVEALAPLGGGLEVVRVGETRYVRSVPRELSSDALCVVARARDRNGRLTAAELAADVGWTRERAADALETATELGAALVDDGEEEREEGREETADPRRGGGREAGGPRVGGEGSAVRGGPRSSPAAATSAPGAPSSAAVPERRVYWIPAAGIDEAIEAHKKRVQEKRTRDAAW